MRLLMFSILIMLLSCGQDSGKDKKQTQQDSLVKKTDTTYNSPNSNTNTAGEKQAQGSIPDEAAVNDLLKKMLGDKWRVLTDKDVKDKSDYYDETVLQGRKSNPNFPFIVKADFNGDNKTDYAVLATNDEQEYQRLLTKVYVIMEGSNPVTFEESTMPTTTLSIVKKSATVEGFMDDKDKKIVMKTEGLEVMTGESGGYYLYWDGKSLKMLYTLE